MHPSAHRHAAILAIMVCGLVIFPAIRPADLLAQFPGTSQTGGDWLCFRGNPEHTGKTELAGPPEEIEMKWRWRVNYGDDPISASPLLNEDGTIYIATQSEYLGVINPGSGPGWIYKVDGPVSATPAVNADGDVFVITTDGYAYYLDASGELRWKCDLAVDIESSPVISGDTVYIGAGDQALYTIDLTPDNADTFIDSTTLLPTDILKGSFVAEGPIRSSPAFAGNTVFFGGGDMLYALNPNASGKATTGGTTTGTGSSSDNATSGAAIKWTYDVHAEINASPAVYNDAVYVGADDGYLYAFSENVTEKTTQGIMLWKGKTGGKVRASPAVDDRDGDVFIYVGSDDGKLYAFDEQGEREWEFVALDAIRSSPAIDGNGDIYFGCDDGYVYALYPDGSLKWKFKTQGMVRSSPAIGPDNHLYVGSDDGYLYCIGPSTKENREPDIDIDLTLSLADLENNGNPTTITATISSDNETQSVVSRIASVEIDLSALNLFGCKSTDIVPGLPLQVCDPDLLARELMFDDGYFEDDTAGDGTFTYAFGISDTPVIFGYDNGILNHFLALGFPGLGPVPLMVTVTDLFGNRVSQPFALNIVQRIRGGLTSGEVFEDTVKNRLSRQTLEISFTSGNTSILSIDPDSGRPGQRLAVSILGKNTNFTKNKTRVEILNDNGTRIASALPENDDVDVLSDTELEAVLSIIKDEPAGGGALIGRWDVIVTTVFDVGSPEVVVGDDLFEISEVPIEETASGTRLDRLAAQQSCVFTLDVTNDQGGRANGSPWVINNGYARTIEIPDARSGAWTFHIALSTCPSNPSFKIITNGSNYGFLIGEVKNGFTGIGIDNATVQALTGEGLDAEANTTVTAGGGYYLLPLSAVDESYTVIASKDGMIDIEREVVVEAEEETKLNFSLQLALACPLTELAPAGATALLYRLRDEVLNRSTGGTRWVGLYYRHAEEVSRLLRQQPALRTHCSAFVARLMPQVGLFLASGRLSRDINAELQPVLDHMSLHASPELKRALAAERGSIRQFLQEHTAPF